MKKPNWNLWFYLPFFFALLVGGAILPQLEKGKEVLFINGMHTSFLDNLFSYGTQLGNGVLYILVALMLFWKNVRNAIIALITFSLTGIIIQVLKKLAFPEMMRPSVLLAGEPLHFVEGVRLLKNFSFPSGHTAMAFSLFCFLSQIIKPRWSGIVFIMMALIGGISRIYLIQHFFIDVYFGAIAGVLITSLIWWWFSLKNTLSHLDKQSLFPV